MLLIMAAALFTGPVSSWNSVSGLGAVFLAGLMAVVLGPLWAPLAWFTGLAGALFGGSALLLLGRTDRLSFALVGAGVGLLAGLALASDLFAKAPGDWVVLALPLLTGAIAMQLDRAILLRG